MLKTIWAENEDRNAYFKKTMKSRVQQLYLSLPSQENGKLWDSPCDNLQPAHLIPVQDPPELVFHVTMTSSVSRSSCSVSVVLE